MGVWDTVRSWFKSEADELTDAKEDLEARLDQDLTRRERQLDETPAEALERLQREAADGDASFSAISDKIDATAARAAAAARAEAEAGTPTEIDPDFLDGNQAPDGAPDRADSAGKAETTEKAKTAETTETAKATETAEATEGE